MLTLSSRLAKCSRGTTIWTLNSRDRRSKSRNSCSSQMCVLYVINDGNLLIFVVLPWVIKFKCRRFLLPSHIHCCYVCNRVLSCALFFYACTPKTNLLVYCCLNYISLLSSILSLWHCQMCIVILPFSHSLNHLWKRRTHSTENETHSQIYTHT